MPVESPWPGDVQPVRSVSLPSTTGKDKPRRCIECGADCTDLCAAIFVGDWWFYCIPHAIEFTRSYLRVKEATATTASPAPT